MTLDVKGFIIVDQLLVPLLETEICKAHILVALSYLPSIQL